MLEYSKIKKEIAIKGYSIKSFIEDRIGLTEDGFYKAVRNHTLKVRDLEKISEELNVPISYWFEEEDAAFELQERTTPYGFLSKEYKDVREKLIHTQEQLIKHLEERLVNLEAELKSCRKDCEGVQKTATH